MIRPAEPRSLLGRKSCSGAVFVEAVLWDLKLIPEACLAELVFFQHIVHYAFLTGVEMIEILLPIPELCLLNKLFLLLLLLLLLRETSPHLLETCITSLKLILGMNKDDSGAIVVQKDIESCPGTIGGSHDFLFELLESLFVLRLVDELLLLCSSTSSLGSSWIRVRSGTDSETRTLDYFFIWFDSGSPRSTGTHYLVSILFV